MTSLKVNEIFYSIQGEGARAGCPSIFIRLSGCDLTCGFCDTEFESGKEMTLDEILDHIKQYPCKDIVWTGGEPTLQLTDDIVLWFDAYGYYQCIETNGGHKVPTNIDFISISPKVANHVLAQSFPDLVYESGLLHPGDHISYSHNCIARPDCPNRLVELRYVRHSGQLSLPDPPIYSDYKFLSPMFNGDQPDYKNIQHCINLIKGNPTWKLSLQMHKFLKVL